MVIVFVFVFFFYVIMNTVRVFLHFPESFRGSRQSYISELLNLYH